MDPEVSDLLQMTEVVWSTVLGLPLEQRTETDAKAPGITGCVHITGAWEGVLLIFAAGELGRTLAASMFAMDAAEVTESETIDAICEIANILGGNIKALVPQPSLLSLPSTLDGPRANQHFPRTREVCGLNLTCEGEQLSVLVLKKVTDDATRTKHDT